MITALPVEVGQVVSAGQLIARVARLDELEAVVSIPESRIDADRNAAATVTLWADADRVYEARPLLARQVGHRLTCWDRSCARSSGSSPSMRPPM